MKSFKLGFYPAAVLPFIIAFLTNASCTVGLVTATEEASGLVTYGPEHSVRLQGGLLGDGGQPPAVCDACLLPVVQMCSSTGTALCCVPLVLACLCQLSHPDCLTRHMCQVRDC